jgi:membrane protein
LGGTRGGPCGVVARWRRDLATGLVLVSRALWSGAVGFYNSDNLTHAAAIAYFALLSIFPMFLLFYSAVGSLAATETYHSTIAGLLQHAFPAQFDFLTRQLGALAQSRLRLGAGSAIALIWASLGFFSAVTSAVNHAWGVEKPRSYLKSKLFALLMMVAAGLVLVAVLGAAGAVNIARARAFRVVTAEWPALPALAGVHLPGVSMVLVVVMVGLVFYFVPNTKVRLRDIWVGALLTVVLWRAVLWLFGYYIRDMSRFNLIHGSIAAVVVFLVWVYTSAAVLLYGAEFTAAYHRLRRAPRFGG